MRVQGVQRNVRAHLRDCVFKGSMWCLEPRGSCVVLQHRQSSRLSLSPKIVWLEQMKYVRGEMSEWPRVQQELCTGGTENSRAKPSQMCQP